MPAQPRRRKSSPKRWTLVEIVAALERQYGPPPPPESSHPFEIILLENVAYLVDDARRLEVWRAFKRAFGTRPETILAASRSAIVDVIRPGGMQPERRADKVLETARLVRDEHHGDLRGVLAEPLTKARRALKKFPGIGEPGVDKILLFTCTAPILALESNGLRALLRLGFGREDANYSKSYKSVQAAITDELNGTPETAEFDWLIAAHQLLRRHGQTLCKRTDPDCAACPLAKRCPAASEVS